MCFDYHENEERKKREQRQAEALRLEEQRAVAKQTANTLSRDLSTWGASTTKRIYQVIGAKGGKLPASLKGDFNVDGFKIHVKKAGRDGGPRVFLVVSKRRQVPVGSVGRAKFTPHETRVITANVA